MNCIEITGLSKSYQKDFWSKRIAALSDVSFSIEKNRITGFVGPNGAGKTTTIKAVTGLIRADRGSVKVNGIDIKNVAARRGVAYMSEQPYFYGHLTVRESLEFASNLLSLPHNKINSEINRALDIVELSHKSKSKVKEMSKGMQQRLNMAQAILGKRELMILDEPMSGMDPPGRRLFRNLFRQLESEGITIFFSTHVLEDIESVCSDIVVLSKGKLSYCGSVNELLKKGLAGTEITISGENQGLNKMIEGLGCKVIYEKDGTVTVIVPQDKDRREILRLMSDTNIFPLRVENRTESMEELLYGNSTGGAA